MERRPLCSYDLNDGKYNMEGLVDCDAWPDYDKFSEKGTDENIVYVKQEWVMITIVSWRLH